MVSKRKRQQSKPKEARIKFLLVAVFILAAACVARLLDLQVLKYESFVALAEGQHSLQENLIPERGKIYVQDRDSGDLFPLAINEKLNLVYAVPRVIQNSESNLEEVAEKLEPLLEISKEEIIAKLEKPDDLYEPLKHEIDDETKSKIEELEIPGIEFQPEPHRFYPEKSLASHILGFVGYVSNLRCGQYGVEGYYEEMLKGEPGRLVGERSATGMWVSIGNMDFVPAQDGDDLVLTIDRVVQYKVEKELASAVQNYGATKGSAIVLDSKSGEILALANFPNFDPNLYSEVEDVNVFKNSTIYDLYEPGSVLKPILMGAALNSGLVGPNTTHECTGSVEVGKYTIHTSDMKAHGTETMTEVLENSCNVGMVFVNQLLGINRAYDCLNKFGFLDLSGIDLDTEIPASIPPKEKWNEVDLATAGFGQGAVTVTPMRLITAFSAIANGGELVQPHIVKKIIHSDGGEEIIKPKVVREVLSSSTAATLSAMMVSAVKNGVAYPAYIPGYRIAGKTGTAQVPAKDKPGYDLDKKITSFVGWPIDDPKFIVLIKFNFEKGNVWGATTAAPMFKRLAQELFKYYQIPPSE